MIERVIAAFIATLTFGVLFNIPKSELIYCGIIGSIGWLTFELVSPYFSTSTAPIFLATLIITALSRVLSRHRKTITTIYLTTGIIPFVPGAGIYNTMYHIIYNEANLAVVTGIETLMTAGVIAMGIIVVLSLPNKIFFISFPFIKRS